MRVWLGTGVFVIGFIVLLASIVLLVRWWMTGSDRSMRRLLARPDGALFQPWMPLGYLGMGLIQLGPVINGDHAWWMPVVWLFLAAATGSAQRVRRRPVISPE